MPNFVRDDFWPSSSSSPSDEQQVSTSSSTQSTISSNNSTATTPNLQPLLDAFPLATVILPVAFNILQYCYYFSIIIEADHRKMNVVKEDVYYSSIPNMTDFIINNEKQKEEESLFGIIRNSRCLDEIESSSLLLLCSTKSEILVSKNVLRHVLNKKGVTTTENGGEKGEDLSCSTEETSSTKKVLREMVKEMKSENTTFLNTTLRHIVKNIENIARWRKFEVPVVNDDEEENKNYNYNDDGASSSSPSTMTEAVSVTTISGIGEETNKKRHQKQLPNHPEEITLLLFRELINEYFVPICDTIANINTAATTTTSTTNFCLHHAAPFISDYLLQTVALVILYPYLGMPLWMKRWMVVVFTGSMITTTATSSNIQEVVDTSTSTIENAGDSNNMLSLLWRKLTSSLVTVSASTTTTGTSSVAGESSSSPSDREQDQETCFLVFSISIVLLILLGIVHLRFKKYVKTLTV